MSEQAEWISPTASPGYAFFFDVDGTLAAIQSRPDEVFIPATVRQRVAALALQCQGAVALVSGRPIAELDALLAPLVLPAAGIHGAERRTGDEQIQRVTLPQPLLLELAAELARQMSTLPGAELEDKGIAFALHYRRAPQHQPAIERLAAEMVARYPAFYLQPGKCVVELKPAGVSKGEAIGAFMQQPPFAGRIPVFLGDDLTDEAGFAVVNALGGVSIKVGEGESAAGYRLQDVAAVWQWLETTQLQLQQGVATSEEQKV